MKAKKTISGALILIILISLSLNTYAAQWEDFSDIKGHWAEETLRRSFNDGLISGFEDNTLAPDAPITTAQMITVLCRVLGATETADASSLGISADAWYFDSASKALRLGLISSETGNLEADMTRQNALSMMAKAFCLVPAEPNFAELSQFSDTGSISANNKGALAALVSEKFVTGYGGALNVSSSITRAEFFTVLYRVAQNYITSDALSSGTQGNSVLRGNSFLSYISTGKIWFDSSAESVTLSGVKSDTVTLRSHKLNSFSISNGSDLSRLVIAVGTGSAALDFIGSSKIGQLQLEACTSASVGSGVGSIEITGNGISTSISGTHDSLIITGSNNTVTLSAGVSLTKVKIMGDNNIVKAADSASLGGSASCADIEISGNGNTLAFNNSAETPCKLLVSGSLNNISAKSEGNIEAVTLSGNSNWLSLVCKNLSSVVISGNYNTVNKQDAGKVEAVEIPGVNNVFVLYEENELVSAQTKGLSNTVTINGAADNITLYGRKTILDGSGKVKSLNISASDCTISLAAETIADNGIQAEEDRVLELVTLGYAGDFTLKWAQEHDYETSEKEIWVNAKEYTSKTEYLLWINLSMQRVNIFKGSEGAWSLCYSCIVGTGAPGRGTPVGIYNTTYKSWAGWTTPSYTVKPVVGFKINTGYAFHSRLYNPGGTKLSDASIGFPVSHGCVRMYDEDVLYIYNNIPLGTTVVVY
ncbi:MAG: S-layer homology domain-containing protein [Oscillospiraceae bacterium]|nr:S-layer homology domain-containing protein [Oscillospiraceae bacterium]